MAVAETGNLLSNPAKARGWLQVTSLLTVLSVFALVVLGGVVRVTESGLGCPDWPLCHGKLLPPLEMTAIIEYTHRLVTSALVTPLVLLTCALVWLTQRHEGWLVVPATLAVGLLLAQALLGGVTVLTELPGGVVAAHLALAEAHHSRDHRRLAKADGGSGSRPGYGPASGTSPDRCRTC